MQNWDFPDTAKPGSTPDTFAGALRVFWQQPGAWLIGSVVAVALVARVAIGDWSLWDLLAAAVVVAWWPFQEWLIHVFILHFRPRTVGRRVIDFENANKHRAHHRDPWRIELVFMPLFSLVPGVPVVALLCWLIAPSPALAATAFLTFMVLLLHYEWVHMIAHTRWGAKSGIWAPAVRDHQLHHFKNERYWMGVSMRLGDRVLRTSPDPETVARSTTVRTLGIEPKAHV
jgi:hypothetical protein